MQANLTYEVTFRRWITATITTHGFYDRITAINEGAEVVGCSPATTARYLAKLTSASGPLTQAKDALGYSVLILKPHLQTPAHEP
jgi:predicted chitinase